MHFCLHTAQWKPFYLFTHSFQRLENVFICLNEAFHLPAAPSQPVVPNGYCHNGVPQCNAQVERMRQWWKGVKKKPCENASFGPLYKNIVWTRNDPRERCQLIRKTNHPFWNTGKRSRCERSFQIMHSGAIQTICVLLNKGKYVIISYDLVFVQLGKI